jgi:hypothetical protein
MAAAFTARLKPVPFLQGRVLTQALKPVVFSII